MEGEEARTLDDLMAPKLDDIYEVEEWSQQLLGIKVKDSLWEVQVAMILETFAFTAESRRRCRRSLELDPSNWRASYYLAHATSSHSEAIQILEAIVKRFETDHDLLQVHHLEKPFAEVLFDLGQRYWTTKHFDCAIQYHIRSIQVAYTGCERVLAVMEQYHSQRRWSDILALLETTQREPTGDPQNLADMMVDLASQDNLHEILLQTTIETGQFDLMEKMYETAIETAMKRQVCTSLYYLRYYYANAVYQQPESEERAIGLWELALKDDLPRTALEVEDILPDLTRKLAPLYLRRARSAERDPNVARTYLERISGILPAETSENNIVFPAKLYLARYYYAQGDKLRAKQIARSVVKMALEILSDGDWDNDYLAYWRLLLVFLPLEDDKNAHAAVALAGLVGYQPSGPPPEELKQQQEQSEPFLDITRRTTEPKPIASSQEEETTPENQKEDQQQHQHHSLSKMREILKRHSLREKSQKHKQGSSHQNNHNHDNNNNNRTIPPQSGPVFAVCDANCGHGWTTASEMWWCRECINLTLDQSCYQRLKNGMLQLNICDRQHEFLFIPKWDEEKMRVRKGLVPYGEGAISLDEWKRVIWREYVDIDVPVGRRMSRCF